MKVLVIDRTGMAMGGIETYYSVLMKYAISRGYRVIWLTTPKNRNNSQFKDITELDSVESVYVRNSPFGPLYPKLDISSSDDVVVLTNDPVRFVLSEQYREQKNRSFVHLLMLPHYTGAAYYPEMIFRSDRRRSYWHKKMGELARCLCAANCVRGFSGKHLTAYADSYGINNIDVSDNTLPRVKGVSEMPVNRVLERECCRKDRFEIITCARFDFPHKGYILGLIRSFKAIHHAHPQARLTIVGYGNGESEVKKEVSLLPPAAAECVELTGMLSNDALRYRLDNAHLFVGLAGSLLQAAECALPSICMKHYTNDCEGYGYYDCSINIISESAGQDMTQTISDAVDMSKEEYIACSRASFLASIHAYKVDPEYVFRQEVCVDSPQIPVSIYTARRLYLERLILSRLVRRPLFETLG